MSFATSTDAARPTARPSAATAYRPWQFYMLLSLAAATVAVVVTKQTAPAALLLLSAAIMAAGAAASAFHYALAGFFGLRQGGLGRPLSARTRDALVREKFLTLRSIKELEFDHAMKKIDDADFAELAGRLRARALDLMKRLEEHDAIAAAEAVSAGGGGPAQSRASAPASTAQSRASRPAAAVSRVPEADASRSCPACDTLNDTDARFCKSCGAKLG